MSRASLHRLGARAFCVQADKSLARRGLGRLQVGLFLNVLAQLCTLPDQERPGTASQIQHSLPLERTI